MINPEYEDEDVDLANEMWDALVNQESSDEEFDAFCAMLNSEIACELGWRFSESNNTWNRDEEQSENVPNYLYDLNLAQEIYDDLREDEEIQYANILTTLLNNGIILPGMGFRPCPLIFATPWQKCQAFAILREL